MGGKIRKGLQSRSDELVFTYKCPVCSTLSVTDYVHFPLCKNCNKSIQRSSDIKMDKEKAREEKKRMLRENLGEKEEN